MEIKEALDIVDGLVTCELEWSSCDNPELIEAWNKIVEVCCE